MKKIEIIHEDDHVILVNKPAFALTIPDRYAPEKFNILHSLRQKREEVFVVHRLDKETSGILIFAKTEAAHKHLSQQFEKRTVTKKYLTLLDGNLHEEEGIIDKPIAPHPFKTDRMVIAVKGKKSVTEWKVLERFKNFTLVEADIKTGRTHQIRVHFEAMGYPLAVDPIYSRRKEFLLSEIKHRRYRLGKNQEERPLMSRSILHAHSLDFEHPETGERMKFEAELPKDFRAVVAQLRKWGR